MSIDNNPLRKMADKVMNLRDRFDRDCTELLKTLGNGADAIELRIELNNLHFAAQSVINDLEEDSDALEISIHVLKELLARRVGGEGAAVAAPHFLSQTRTCGACNKQTRVTIVGCDHCEWIAQ